MIRIIVIPRLTRYCRECYREKDWHGAIVYMITLLNALDRDGKVYFQPVLKAL